MSTIPNTTLNGNWLYYAVEVASTDGRFVICKTQSLEIALIVLGTRIRKDEDGFSYMMGEILPYDSKHDGEVWLGFSFHHKGAKEAVYEIGNYAEETCEAVLSKEGHSAIFSRITEESRRLLGY